MGERLQFSELKLLVGLDVGKQFFFLGQFSCWIVASFDVSSEETFELNRSPCGLEDGISGMDSHHDAQFPGVGHLRCDGPFPDQFKESELIVIEFVAKGFRDAESISCGTDRFVSFLGIFDFGCVGSLGVVEELGAILGANQTASRCDGFLR